jgi:tetratricopeptide (TPR) repeat protein
MMKRKMLCALWGAVLCGTLAAQVCNPPISDEARKNLETRLAEAEANLKKAPQDPDTLIWAGRRLAYLNRFDEAIAKYTEGIGRFPKDARFYRHRGHRYITLRKYKEAIADLSTAAGLVKNRRDETEPDGLPNARNIPTSTLNSNIYYHLGLAYYLQGDFARALHAYRECMKFSANPDMLVATSHWLYMTLRRLGREREAVKVLTPVKAEMDIIENGDYHRLLLMHKGQITPETLLAEATKGGALSSATIGYGVGNWYFYNNQREQAHKIWQSVTAGTQCNAFAYIAAEAELARAKHAK